MIREHRPVPAPQHRENREEGIAAVNAVVVSCCQVTPALGDPAANRELAADAISHAAAQGASVVVLPELVSSGYVFDSRADAKASAEAADGETITLWARLAADHGVVIVGGFCETTASGELFNSAALVDPGGLRAVYRKAHLWDKERLWFSSGSTAPPVIPTLFGRIAVMICYDLEFPDWVRLPALDGAQLLCAPVNWPAFPRPDGERPAEIVRVQADAAVNRMFIAACDRTGEERVKVEGIPYEWVDEWEGTPNETSSSILLVPMTLSPWSCAN
jgi:5-aminopentanamidase